METHSSTLAWKIPWTEEPEGLQSMGLQSRTQLKRLSSSSSIIIIIILQYNLLLFSFVFTSKLRKLLPQGSGYRASC